MPTVNDQLLARGLAQLRKTALAPTEQIAPPQGDPTAGMPEGPPPGAPVDPATGQPIDPAAAGGAAAAPPVDPAAAGMPVDPATGQPMDPAAAAAPPGEDPVMMIIEMLTEIQKEVLQTRKIVASMADQGGFQMPLNEVLDSGEDPLAEAKKANFVNPQDGDPEPFPDDAGDYLSQAMPPERRLDAVTASVQRFLRNR